MLIIGLMSGTSVDAIDAALVQISRKNSRYSAQVLAHHEHPWPKSLRHRLLAAMAPAQTTTQEICQLNFLVAHHFAAAVQHLLKITGTPATQITALASHGQTICHLPPNPQNRKSKIKNRKSPPSTLQLGDPSVLSALTGIQTLANFRSADIALGGQGAPLVPFADFHLLSHPSKSRVIQNIGGIANLTFLPPLTQHSALNTQHSVLAFDTGPGNMLLDAVISLATQGQKTFDKNGHLAAAGTLDTKLLQKLQSHPYFRQPPPKSTGRELFGTHLAKKLLSQIENRKSGGGKIENLLHTLTRLTAWSIAHAYRTHLPQLPDEVIFCGGGIQNPTLLAMLQQELPNTPFLPIDHFGIPNKSKEAASFALLAAATLDGLPSNLPSVTGASRPTLLGTLSNPIPKNHQSRK